MTDARPQPVRTGPSPRPADLRQEMIEALSLALAGLGAPGAGLTRWIDRMETAQ